ncbi:NADPH:quinone reductase-like Zn-dependent oxidoreductase [Nocardia tenerifensis]|uniref:NADPH:quinone reductase-like Zn-dependent oxidoreductase n=1 Tax=Nocardia tenerifensis TaxID=228006 RepID=A0A318JN68_9NOCA|nr:zinc-binding dehydrogenase [Nocardia tenerifensis]PXX52686.1 NADPH:quinone reductase-like Zn-dependent oxidoreductase [Nocardia tenerifensis]
MRAVTIETFGEPKDVLTTAERPLPEPGAGEVRVELILAPIHNHDLAIVRGVYGYKPPLPAIPGTEGVGRIDALGPGVTGLTVGQRITVSGAQNVWAEYFVVKAGQVVPVPDEVSDETAAQLLAMPLSALMLLEDLGVAEGEWIAINAANGAVGRLVNVLARQRGVNVLNLVRGPKSVQALRAAGFEPVFDTEAEGWRDAAVAATSGAPIVRAVDQVGGGAASDAMALLAPKGELISFGALSGQPMTLSPGDVIFKQAVVKGFWGSKRIEETSAEDRRRLIGELVTAAAQGVLRLDAEATYPLDAAADAAVATESPGRSAKVMLAPRV